MGEVDHDLGTLERLDRVVLVDRRHELQIRGRLDGPAHLNPDAPSGAKHSYPDHGTQGYTVPTFGTLPVPSFTPERCTAQAARSAVPAQEDGGPKVP
ncbi:hypothetical protein Ssi02_00790 [Sinosporangium siamense]|uniref:Uncharacterized protein n=1 Tax=Sinosporangium siamense TaxID=1367973 RepID=A0A919R9J6_9ACTN|nr:hypothetical protein Ssi02_00790 [Sinosporangium siamense]